MPLKSGPTLPVLVALGAGWRGVSRHTHQQGLLLPGKGGAPPLPDLVPRLVQQLKKAELSLLRACPPSHSSASGGGWRGRGWRPAAHHWERSVGPPPQMSMAAALAS